MSSWSCQPREISTSCGLSLKIKPADAEESCQVLREGGVEISGVYHLIRDGNQKSITPASGIGLEVSQSYSCQIPILNLFRQLLLLDT